jgi:hypothetical protein
MKKRMETQKKGAFYEERTSNHFSVHSLIHFCQW